MARTRSPSSGRRGGRRAARAAARLTPARRGGDLRCRRGVSSCGARSSASRSPTALGAGALAWSSTLLGEYSVMDMGGGDARARRPRGHGERVGRDRGIRNRRRDRRCQRDVADRRPGPPRRRARRARRPTGDDRRARRARDRGLHRERRVAGSRDPRAAGRPRRGRVRERVGRRRAPPCTGTASTCRTRPTASRASRRTRSPSAAVTSTASRRPMPARTGTTRTRCRTSRSSAGCSARSSSTRPTPSGRSRPTSTSRRAPARLRRPAHAERTGRGRAGDGRARLDRAGARHQHRPGHRRRLVGRAVPGARDRRTRGERPDRRRRPQAAHPGGRASGCRGAGAARGAVRLHVGGARSMLIGDPAASAPPAPQPSETLDLLAYGDPGAARTSTRRRPTARSTT